MSGTRSRRENALAIAKDLRLKVQDDERKISTLLMGCRTICRYLDNLEENLWIEQELNGYDTSKFKNLGEQDKALPDYRSVTCVYYNQFHQPLVFPKYEIGQMLSTFKIPNAITELETVKNLVITGSGLLEGVNRLNRKSPYPIVEAVVTDNATHAVLAGVRNRIYEFLDKIILELEYGEIPETVFEDIRREVDSKMVDLCPNAINKLQVAYENASRANPESWSHVASSCRRIIHDVADTIFLPQQEPIKLNGKEYAVDDSKSINRIYAGLKLKSTSDTTLKFNLAMIEYVFSFLRNIQSYSSKGDHSTFNKTDAARCVVYTYMLLGDILNYYVQSDAVTKRLGRPYDSKEGIQKYKDRDDAPFEELLLQAKKNILFVSTSHEIVTKYQKK